MKNISKIVIIVIVALFTSVNANADEPSAANRKQAKELFNKIYNMVFGPKGSSLTYKVNIIGLYKTEGNIMYKGKKVHYDESRYSAYEDGVTAYMVDKKKKTVGIYRYDDDNKDKYLSKFKYDINNFNFSYTADNTYYYITADVKSHGLFGIRSVVAKVNKSNLYPVSMTIKIAFFSTTVQISNFKAGGISDNAFVFPKSKFPGYTYQDHRKD